jgi:uncharacterized membrane protein
MKKDKQITEHAEKRKRIGIVSLIIALIILGIGVYCAYLLFGEHLGFLFGYQVTKTEGFDTFQGFNYVFVVKCGVTNKGLFGGTAKVTSTFSGQGKSEKQTKQIYVGNGEYKEVEFIYDISFWRGIFDPSYFTYQCYTGI